MKLDRSVLIAAMLICCATGLRLLLAALGWPPTNSDEGTMALIALNVAARRDYPLMFYGQSYMGSLEAYLGAAFFRLTGGPSIFALRLGVILLLTLFLVSLYLLAWLLFGKGLALLTLAMLVPGSSPVLMRGIIATGGSVESLLFGSLAFLLAIWLALTIPDRTGEMARRLFWQRLLAYWFCGLIFGLGFWSDMIVLPFFAMALLLLMLFCWCELLSWRWLLIISGGLLGALPLLLYDWRKGLDPLTVLLGLTQGSEIKAPQALPGILYNLFSTLQISLPTATGQPFCPVMEVPAWGLTSPNTLSCMLVRASWSFGYLLLLGLAFVLTMRTLRYLRFSPRDIISLYQDEDKQVCSGRHQALVQTCARLFLLSGALLALVVYALSSGPVNQPGFHARYLVTLLIATPALLSPLWSAAAHLDLVSFAARLRTYVARVALMLIWLLLLAGSVLTLLNVPEARAEARGWRNLMQTLTSAGISHFYTDYWTCYNLIVASDERLICANLYPPNLLPSHNRAPRYYDIVRADPAAALVFPRGSAQLAMSECQFVRSVPGAYRRLISGNYIIYQPILGGAVRAPNLRQAVDPGGVQKWRPGCGPVAVTSEK